MTTNDLKLQTITKSNTVVMVVNPTTIQDRIRKKTGARYLLEVL